MADQTIEIRLVLRDELSRQLAPINAQLRQLANTRVDAAHAGFQRLAPAVRVVHRELSTLSRITLGGLVGGGVVAGIATAIRAMQDMARQQIQLHYSAQQLGVSTKFIENYRDALTGLGEAPETAAASIKQSLATLDEFFVKGPKSSLGAFLEKSIGGPDIARRLRKVLAEQGEEAGLAFLASVGSKIKDRRGQAEFFKQAGLPFAAKDIAEILPLLGKRVQLNAEQMKALALANAQYERSSRNIGLILGAELTPAVTKVMQALDNFLRTESGKKFAKQIGDIAKQVSDAIADWVTKGGLQKTLDTLTAAFTAADDVIQGMGLSWPKVIAGLALGKFASELVGLANALRIIITNPQMMAVLAIATLWFNKKEVQEALTQQREQAEREHPEAPKGGPTALPGLIIEILKDLFKGNIDLWGTGSKRPPPEQTPAPKPQSGEGKPETEQERRAAQAADERERDALNRELQQLAESTGHLADYLQIGGPEGTADGRSGYQLDSDSGGGAGGGPSLQWQSTPLPAGSFAARARMERYAPLREFMRRINTPPPPPRTNFNEWENAPAPPGYGPGGNLPRPGSVEETIRGQEGRWTDWDFPGYHKDVPFYLRRTGLTAGGGGGDRSPLGEDLGIAGEVGARARIPPWEAPTIPQLSPIIAPPLRGYRPRGPEMQPLGGGGVASDESGISPITQMLARQDTSLSGSATVDIDVGGLAGGGRNPAALFKPQPMDGAVQMQNAHHVPDNRLSFQ